MTDRMTWSEFWPFYLEEHNNRRNRWTHFIGTSLAVVFIAFAIVWSQPWYLLVALFCGYAFAWVGHFFLQKNRPATFRYPIKSFCSDWRLWALTFVGLANREYEKHGIEQQ